MREGSEEAEMVEGGTANTVALRTVIITVTSTKCSNSIGRSGGMKQVDQMVSLAYFYKVKVNKE